MEIEFNRNHRTTTEAWNAQKHRVKLIIFKSILRDS